MLVSVMIVSCHSALKSQEDGNSLLTLRSPIVEAAWSLSDLLLLYLHDVDSNIVELYLTVSIQHIR